MLSVMFEKVSRIEDLASKLVDQLKTTVETQPLPTVLASAKTIVEEMNAIFANGSVRKPVTKVVKTVKSDKPTVSKATKVSDVAGRGRKECPACHKFVGARATTCPACTHAFEVAAPKAPKAPKAEGERSQGRRVKGESLSDKLLEVLTDAANDGRRKEPSLDLGEIMLKLVAIGYKSNAKEKNLRVAVQARLSDLVKSGAVLKSEDRKYSVKVEPAAA